jgi:hypothetical protein
MANAVTSVTGTAASPVVTFKISNPKESYFVYVRYAKGNGTSATLTLKFLNPNVHASEVYQHSAFATATIAPVTATFDADGNHRFEIPACPAETQLVATFAFTGGTTQAVVSDLYPN